MTDAVRDLQQQTQAAAALRDSLAKLPGMDDETVRDTIEGETSLHETIAAAVDMLTEAEFMAEGLEGKIKQFQARLQRYKDRKDFVRSAIEQAMTIGNLKTLELPDCTLTVGWRAGGVKITDEALIPAKFWKPQDPALDKAAIAAALKAKEAVPGAGYGNGGVSLTVRRA